MRTRVCGDETSVLVVCVRLWLDTSLPKSGGVEHLPSLPPIPDVSVGGTNWKADNSSKTLLETALDSVLG